jgi:hypothetical protein
MPTAGTGTGVRSGSCERAMRSREPSTGMNGNSILATTSAE